MNAIRLVALIFLTVSIGVALADSVVVPIMSASELPLPATVTSPEIKYTGKKISCNFKDTSIRSVLAIIADFSGTTMVISDAVTGNVTIHLDNVPWDEALDLILKSKGLDKIMTNNVILIAPIEEIKAHHAPTLVDEIYRKDDFLNEDLLFTP